MAHKISLNLNEKVVLHKDVEIEVKQDGSKLGTLLISKGNIEWLPSGNSVNKFQIQWKKFAEMMKEHGKAVKF